MRAAQISQYGDAGEVRVSEVPRPNPGPGQVLVEVHSASLNPFDTTVREGYLKDKIPLKLPVTLGGDIAGVVSGVGEGVTEFKPGDKVYGSAAVVAGGSGAFAEFAVTKTGQIGAMPDDLSFTKSAALSLVGLSAVQALEDYIHLQRGQKILIHGGAGAVGSVAIQAAHHLGAYVAATASGPGLDYARKLGADKVIDYTKEKFEDESSDYDAIFDTVGGEAFTKSYEVLRKGGILVSMREQPNQELGARYGVTATTIQTRTSTEALSRLTKLVDAGVITPHVGRVFPLNEARHAFEVREAGHVLGKVVLEIHQ